MKKRSIKLIFPTIAITCFSLVALGNQNAMAVNPLISSRTMAIASDGGGSVNPAIGSTIRGAIGGAIAGGGSAAGGGAGIKGITIGVITGAAGGAIVAGGGNGGGKSNGK